MTRRIYLRANFSLYPPCLQSLNGKTIRKSTATDTAAISRQPKRRPSSAQAVHFATETCDPDVVGVLTQADRAIVDATTSRGHTPLHIAVIAQNDAVLDFLLRAGADLSVGDERLITPLHFAAKSSTAAVVQILVFLEQGDNRTLALGAALAMEDYRGCTPLHIASGFGNLRCSVKFRVSRNTSVRHLLNLRIIGKNTASEDPS